MCSRQEKVEKEQKGFKIRQILYAISMFCSATFFAARVTANASHGSGRQFEISFIDGVGVWVLSCMMRVGSRVEDDASIGDEAERCVCKRDLRVQHHFRGGR